MSKISVIIPVYNVEEYLAECLDSVINQTYGNLEIICVNDGSTDNSLKILEAYSQNDSRIKVFSQENKGVSEARNSGIQKANGDYICFVDPDDWIELNMLECLLAKIKQTNADIVECDLLEHQNQKSPKKRNLKMKFGFWNNVKISSGKTYNWINIKNKIFYIRAYCWNKLYKTDLIKNKIFFEGRINEDFFFCLEVFLSAKKIVYLNKNLYHYRKRDYSLSNGGLNTDQVQFEINKSNKEIEKIKIIMDKLQVEHILEKEFKKYTIERMYINFKQNCKYLKLSLKESLDDNEYLKLEQKIANSENNFLQSLFSVKTEIMPCLQFKKIKILGYTIIKKS